MIAKKIKLTIPNKNQRLNVNELFIEHYVLWSRLFASVVIGYLRVFSDLAPQYDLITPGITKRVIESLEFRPEMIAPEDFGTESLGGGKDPFRCVIVTHKNP